jgi:cytochrome c oxidase cbb3-type subunit 2
LLLLELGIALSALLVPGACSGPAKARRTDQPALFGGEKTKLSAPRVASRETGERIYRALCRSCHDDDGGGQTALGIDLDPSPSDLTQCNFKYRSTPSGSLPTDDDLLRTLYVGVPGTAMPSMAQLVSMPALRALAREVKARCDRFGREEPGVPIPPPGWELYSEASARRGSGVYKREGCSACHGARGEGDGPAAHALKDASGESIRPRNYTRGVFRSGFARADIYRAFSTGLDGTPMPALPESVTARDRWDLTHHIVSTSKDRSRLLRALEQGPTWYEPVYTWRLPWR